MLYTRFHLKNIPRIIFAHVYSCPGYKVNFKKMAPNIEIAYIKTGELIIEAGNESFTAKENSFLILPHNYSFTAKGDNNKSHIHYTVSAMIDENCVLVDEAMCDSSENEICLPVYIPPTERSEQVAGLLYEAIALYHKNDHISRHKSGAVVIRLLCELYEISQISNCEVSGKKSEILEKKIKSYIENNLSSKISLSDIGYALGKNPNYLNQVFKTQNHVSIISYVNMEKMKKAATLIVDKGYSVKDAARQVGINDVSYLSRLFKQKMGMNISEYRDNSVDYTFDFADKNKIQKMHRP